MNDLTSIDGLLVVLNLLRGNIEGKVVADEANYATDFNGSKLPGLAGLLAEQRDELVMVGLEALGDLSEELLALLNGSVSPCWEGLLCSCNSIVQVLLAGNWDVPKLLAGGRVDSTVDLVRATLLAVYDVVELLEVEGGDFSWRHGCDVVCESLVCELLFSKRE